MAIIQIYVPYVSDPSPMSSADLFPCAGTRARVGTSLAAPRLERFEPVCSRPFIYHVGSEGQTIPTPSKPGMDRAISVVDFFCTMFLAYVYFCCVCFGMGIRGSPVALVSMELAVDVVMDTWVLWYMTSNSAKYRLASLCCSG